MYFPERFENTGCCCCFFYVRVMSLRRFCSADLIVLLDCFILTTTKVGNRAILLGYQNVSLLFRIFLEFFAVLI